MLCNCGHRLSDHAETGQCSCCDYPAVIWIVPKEVSRVATGDEETCRKRLRAFSLCTEVRLRTIHDKTCGRCWYCGAGLHPLGNWEVEHQNPKAQGGSDSTDNLVPACRECNGRKGNRTVDQYRHSLLVKLENAITEAYEISGDISSYVAPKDFAPNERNPFGYLDEVSELLQHAGDIAVNLHLYFHGEQQGTAPALPPVVSEAEMIV